MRLLSTFFIGALIASTAGVLASPDDEYGNHDDYGDCPDGSKRSPASGISQAGRMPDCTAYVSTSTVTTTIQSTRPASGVVTKTTYVEVDAKTTVVKTTTTTLYPTTVTTTVPFIATLATTTTTTTTNPVVTITSTMLFRRDQDRPPPPPSGKCSCIVLFATVTATQVKDETPRSTTTTTITKSEINTKFTTTTTTVIPTTIVTVSTTITTFTTLTSTKTVTQTSTIVTSIPSACANMVASPVNLAANTISHPEDTYTAIFQFNGVPMADIVSCCATCYTRPGCYSFNFGNFDPTSLTPQLGQSYCQVFVGIDSTNGSPIPNTCPHPERSNFVTWNNPSSFGPGDFFYSGKGPCTTGIDVSTIG